MQKSLPRLRAFIVVSKYGNFKTIHLDLGLFCRDFLKKKGKLIRLSNNINLV